MRIDYPAFLGPTFRDLEWYGAFLRRVHGPGTRRNIKFDEERTSLYMDVAVPHQKEWLRVSPQMARAERDNNIEETERQTRRKLRAPAKLAILTGANAAPTGTRNQATSDRMEGISPQKKNYNEDMEDISRRYSGISASEQANRNFNERRSNGQKPVYVSPKKNV